MVDVNEQVKDLLEQGIGGVTVKFQYPDSFNNLPVVTYYTISQRGSSAYDNIVAARNNTIVIDIWADYPKTCADLSKKINELMSGDGWYHEWEMDVPNTDSSVKHRTMRFTKIFNLQEE